MSNNLEGPRTPNSNSIETSNFIDYNTMDSPPEESTRPRTPQASPSPPPSPSPSSIRTFDFNYDNDNPNTSGNTTPRVEMGTRTNNYRTGTSIDNGGGNPVQITDVKQKVSRSTYIFVMCAALNSCNLGYDIGVNTSAGKLLQSEDSLNLTNVELEIFMGSLNLFAAAGAIFASTISDRYGRKGAFLVAAIGFIFGVLIQSFANSYVALMIGRAFVGLGVGFGLAIDPIYIAEVSPASHRGRLVTWSEIATNVGIVFGFSTGLLFYNVQPDTAWRVMFGMGIILPCVLIYCVLNVMPESPRWLISKGRDIEAKAVLEQIYPVGYDIDALTKQIKDAIRRETEAEATVGWDMIFFPTPAFRRMLLVGVGSAIAQQLVGVDAIQYFLDYILAESGVEEGVGRSLTLLGLGVLKLIVIFYAGRAFDKRGRRPLLFMSLIGITFSVFLLAATFIFDQLNGTIGIIGLAAYLCFFSLGMGPGAWLIPAEVFSTVIRAKAMSLATFMNRATATVVTSSFLTMANYLSYSGFFILLGFVNVGIVFFFHKFLPETKGRSLEEMSLYFAEITGDTSILEAERKFRESSGQTVEANESPQNLPAGTFA